MLTFFLYLSAFIAVTLLVLVISNLVFGARQQVQERLDRVTELDTEEEDFLGLSFSQRVMAPLIDSLQERLLRLAPKEVRRIMQKQLTYAGHPWGLNFNRLVSLQLVLGLMLPLFFLFLSLVSPEGEIGVLQLLGMAAVGFLFPPAIVRFKAAQRQDGISRSMPEMLDLLLISVEAGMGFDMAIKRVTEKIPGDLSRELKRFLEEVQMGMPRSEALRGMVDRTGVEEMWLFANSIIQAEQRWGNIAGTLENQAVASRQRRRRRAEEAARKAPVKMLFPIIFFIFPALFIVILGPGIIRAIQILGGLL